MRHFPSKHFTVKTDPKFGLKGLLPIVLIGLIAIPNCFGSVESIRPVIVVYSPGAPGYGQALKVLIEEDGRFDATVRVCESLQDFDVTMYFPDVKVAVVTLSTDIKQDLNQTLQWFFSQGGGLVGLGFAGSRSASANASENVLPLFGTMYRTGKYDPGSKRFIMKLVKQEEDEISEGVSSFDIPSHKIILNFNSSTSSYQPIYPNAGDYRILFKEETTGAPAVIVYRNEGVSVAFATFGGEDFERSPGYYGLFVDEPEFKTLFTNSLYWVWSNEHKFEEAVQDASDFFNRKADHLEQVKDRAGAQERKAKNASLMRSVAAVAGGAIACMALFWITFIKKPSDIKEYARG